jgi:NADPH-dependent glutamate synthase beta subunit-like oxidoreductase
MIALGRYDDAYMLNRNSNVFPGILGRTCDRPCEPACRRVRIEEEPVAICRLKRVAADLRGDISDRLPKAPAKKNGKRIACIGAGPAALTVANDLMPLGYHVTMFEKMAKPGGLMRTNIPRFRLPAAVLDEEINSILDMGVEIKYGSTVKSMKSLLAEGYDAVFVGSGAPKGKELDIPGRKEADADVKIGIAWLESVAFGHVTEIKPRVVIIGAGNTAMDCCRTAKRLGGTEVKVVARGPRAKFKASPWELHDAEEEKVDIIENHSPHSMVLKNGKLTGIRFERAVQGKGAGATEIVEFPCDTVILAIGQENAFPWIERDIGIDFNKWDMPVVNEITHQCSRPGIFFGGDSAWGPKNIIWAVAHGHQAAISIHQHCQGKPVEKRPPVGMTLTSQKMGLHEWSFDNDFDPALRTEMLHVDLKKRFESLSLEVELGYSAESAAREVARCLNCDIQTKFTEKLCIECDACVDICPTQCLTMTPPGEEMELRKRLTAPSENLDQPLYVSAPLLQTKRLMIKDENLCVHCGLCAERCPTAAWDMMKSDILLPKAGN